MLTPPPSPPPFAIVPVPGKGMGVIATRDIARGELILAEKPLLVLSDSKRSEASIALFLARLPDASQAAYRSLASVHPERASILSIFVTNALPLATSQSGVFEIASRFNHDCTPTLYHHWNAMSKRLEFNATRLIAAGEELSIHYVSPFASRLKRRAALVPPSQFLCACTTCSLPPAEVAASDARREAIQDALDGKPSLIYDPDKIVIRTRQAMADIDTEGLVSGKLSLCGAIFQVCTAHGDYGNAKLWAKLGAECAALGGESGLYQEFRDYEANPKGYFSPGLFPTRKVGGPTV